jgi:DNA-binding response OmpR family regulator
MIPAPMQVQALQRENERLRDRLTVLEESVGVTIRAPRSIKLSRMRERIFCALYRRGFAERDAIMAAMYGGDAYEKDAKILDIYICAIRKVCTPHGIEIKTVWGRGYEMPEASQRIVKAMYDAEQRGTA